MSDARLRIKHLLSYHLYTGPAEPVLRLARAQRQAGHDATVAIDTLRDGDMRARAEAFSVPVDERFVLSVKAGPIMQMRDLLALKRLWRSGEVDVIHCHRSHDHTLAALARPKGAGAALVRTLFSERALGEKRRWQLKRADGLIAVAESHRQRLLERGLLDEDRVVAIEGAVDPHVFRPGKGGDRVREEAGVAPDVPLAGIVARMKPDRGHALLLDAWARVHQALPRARLAIAGRGELEQQLRERVAGAAWGDSVVFLGYRTDLPEVYRAFDLKILLAPGNDGTCRAALEAMATGRPLLASRTGALAEMVEPGQTGWLVEPGQVDALAQALIEALSDRERLALLGRQARHEVTRIHAIDRQSERIEKLYRFVIKGK